MSSPYELVPLRGGAWGIRSLEYGEVCHPGVGPRIEAEALYVRGLDLPGRLTSHAGGCGMDSDRPFVIWDIGLGGAANATAVIEAAAAHSVAIRILSFDRTLGQLAFALQHAGQLDCFGALTEAASALVKHGVCSFRHGKAAVEWSSVLGDFTALIGADAAAAWPAPHAILFDPHSPGANPEMWTLPLFRSLHARLDPEQPCSLATYSRSTAVRAGLLRAGFFVGAGGGTDTKEDTTVAANRRELLARPLDTRWLDRARRSHAAEPWTSPPHAARPLSPESWEQLRNHPQFAGFHGPN